jgi:hypothetical protein
MSHGEAGKGKGMFALVPVIGIPLSLTLKSEIRLFLSCKRSQIRGVISPLSILHLLMSSRRRGSSVFIVYEHWAKSQSSSRSCPISLGRQIPFHADPTKPTCLQDL